MEDFLDWLDEVVDMVEDGWESWISPSDRGWEGGNMDGSDDVPF